MSSSSSSKPECDGYEQLQSKLDADVLINILKNNFELTIDIEKLINDIDEEHGVTIGVEFDNFGMIIKEKTYMKPLFRRSLRSSTRTAAER